MEAVPETVLADLGAAFGAARDGLSFLGGGSESSDGVVYAYEQGGQAYVLKILAIPRKELDGAMAKIEARLRFANYVGEAGVRCAYPLPLPDGTLFARVPHENDVFLGYRMPRFFADAGKPADQTRRVSDYGRLVGKMHRLAKAYPVWRNTTDADPAAPPGWAEELDSFYNWCGDAGVRRVWLALREELALLPFSRDTHGFLHNDPHVQNILFDAQGVVLLDFDVANCQFFMTDVMIASQGVLFGQTGGMERPYGDIEPLKRFFDGFLAGYEQENHLDAFWLSKLDLFIQYRRALLFTVMENYLKTNPEVCKSWKNMLFTAPRVADRLF